MKHGLFDKHIPTLDLSKSTFNLDVDLAEEPKKPDEWIWVIGYKGTDKNMRCRDTQYELGMRYEILVDDDKDIEECRYGYHLCLELRDVFDHYGIGKGNRFFEVRALVRKSDVEKYPMTLQRSKFSGGMWGGFAPKIVSKSIEFIRECTIDEIFKDTIGADWSDEHKKLALIKDLNTVRYIHQAQELTQYGYSLPFAEYIIDHGRYEAAKALGSQTDLSMDMKVLMIFKT